MTAEEPNGTTAEEMDAGPADAFPLLNRRWREALAAALGLSAQTFLSALPARTLDGTDAGLWSYLDALPPDLATFAGPEAGGARFSAEFGSLAAGLDLAPGLLAQTLKAETYAAWVDYSAGRQFAQEELPALFHSWAAANAPAEVAAGLSALSGAAYFAEAASALTRPANFVGGYEALAQTLAAAPACSFTFVSPAAAGEASDDPRGKRAPAVSPASRAGGEPAGLWLGNSDSARLGRLLAAGRVEVRASFGACVVWASTPGAWYNSSLANAAYSTRKSPPWRPDSGRGWADFFGPAGALRRLVASLAVADSARVRLTADAEFGVEDRRLIREGAGRGLWPLYAPAAGGAVTTHVSSDASGRLTVDITSRPGSPLVLGVNVLEVGVYLGHAANSA
jgi:hypothetical protein